jgi:hypothetical protein
MSALTLLRPSASRKVVAGGYQALDELHEALHVRNRFQTPRCQSKTDSIDRGQAVAIDVVNRRATGDPFAATTFIGSSVIKDQIGSWLPSA